MPGAGKRCVDGAYATRKNHEKSVLTDKHGLALGNIGSLKKRRLRRKYNLVAKSKKCLAPA